jgi:uncharacterized protein
MENNNQLPKVIKLFNFAKKERSLGGVYKISSIPRISEIARNKEDNVKVDLSFYLENNKTPCIKGIINLNIILDCQRCLEALPIELKVDFKLAFVRHEQQAEGLDSSYELYVTKEEEEELLTIDIITDEILLSIPMAPSHDFDCNLIMNKDEVVEESRENPFTILKNIKIANDGKE